MKQRLLIVDDEPGIVDMMASYFSSQYEVLTAYCGNEALQKLARQPDLILLDINMPDIDGLTLCQKIRELICSPLTGVTSDSWDTPAGHRVYDACRGFSVSWVCRDSGASSASSTSC